MHVRFASALDGRFRGFGHVEFANAEAAKKVSVADSVMNQLLPVLFYQWRRISPFHIILCSYINVENLCKANLFCAAY